jgi:hypothetical protein
MIKHLLIIIIQHQDGSIIFDKIKNQQLVENFITTMHKKK